MFHVPNCGGMEPTDPHSHEDHDARGLIKIFEPPSPSGIYVMGIDVSNGLTNWNRDMRTDADSRTDNCAIEIVKRGTPDVQVAEYAAPIEPEDLADVANFLGRLYCGRSEEVMAKCIIEVQPGPGMRTQITMLEKYNYFNLYVQTVPDSIVYKPTSHYGWVATKQSVRDLWGRAARHIKRRAITINSPWLIEEMANISMHPDMMWGEAVGRKHDDRVRAFMLAIHALHDREDSDPIQKGVEKTHVPNYQATDISLEDLEEIWQDSWEIMGEEN